MTGIQFEEATRLKFPIPAWVYEQRLLARAEVDADGCWIWTGPCNRSGYGSTSAWKKGWLAHRLAYTVMVGPIPDGHEIDHLCRTRACINPSDLESVTQDENKRRQGAAVTHCPLGHAYTAENTYRAPGSPTLRKCRRCSTEQSRRRAAARRRVPA